MNGLQWPFETNMASPWGASLAELARANDTLAPPSESHIPALESRVLASYVAAASLLVLSLQAALTSAPGWRLSARVFERAHPPGTAYVPPGGYIARHGGWTILPFQILRFLANGTLCGLLIVTAARTRAWGDVALALSAGYTSVLSLVMLCKPVTRTRAVSAHASLSTFALFAALAYRNIWPLLTFVYAPADGASVTLWSTITLAGVAGLFVPLFEPFVYIPFDPARPQVAINPEQTASLASLVTYTFLDSLIRAARRTNHLPAASLPPRSDPDRLLALRSQISTLLTPSRGGQARVLLGLLDSFSTQLIVQALLCTVGAFAELGSPIGTNKLLSYIESGGAGAVVRPWVWIGWIALAPLLLTLDVHFYRYLNTRMGVHLEGILTSLVFTHALKVRVLHVPDDAPPAPGATTASPKPSQLSGAVADPSAAVATTTLSSGASSTDVSTAAESTTHSRGQSSPNTASSTVVGVGTAQSDKEKDAKKKKKAPDDKAEKAPDVVGRLSTLVTSDLSNINAGRDFVSILISFPMQAVLASWFLYSILGWSVLVGLAVMILLIPVPTWTSKLISAVQRKKMAATDARVKRVKETLGVLRMVKQFGWETRVKEQLDEAREEELKWIFRRKLLNLVNICINYTVPLCHMVVTFACYTLVAKKPLSAAIVFSALTGFRLLRDSLIELVDSIPRLIQANVSIGRLQEFLNDAELIDQYSDDASVSDASALHTSELGLSDATFAWSKECATDGALSPSRQMFRLRVEDPLVFKQGSINLIVGPTGCGKSSLLLALLGEMHYIPSGPGAWVNLPRDGGIAYCAQESWIQSMTIKDNILFGAAFDEQRYKKVIHQCGLRRDLTLFDAGDLTEVGEKGLTLSGGQKARIALARAVYSDAECLLLDDILAALDVHTAAWIVKKCLKGDLLKGRTVLLVTHNVALTTPVASFVVAMGSDGRIISQGSPSETLLQDKALAEEVKHEQEAIELEDGLEDDEEDEDKKAAAKGAKLVLAEEIERGHVSWKAASLLIGSFSAWPIVFWSAYLIGRCAGESAEILETWWLGNWARAFSLTNHVNSPYYLGVYSGIVAFILLTYCWCSGLFSLASIRASRIIHDRLASSIIASTFRWLDTTPTSRIIARCTQDIESVDGNLTSKVNSVLSMATMSASRLIAVGFSAPVFILPGIVVATIGATMGQMYLKAQLSVTRERSNAKAPVLATVNGAFAGLISIRAFSAESMFTEQSSKKIDEYTRLSASYWNLNRWIGTRIQALTSAFSGGLCVYLVYGPGHASRSASTIGFALNMAVAFSGQLLWLVRLINQLEVESNSLERIQSYLEIDHEPKPKEGGQPPAYWPASGDLRVENLTARYSPDGPIVLDKVSFRVRAGERVGVVGRTGSGKSTLTLALLRCIFTDGEILYDGLPTQAINLDALRSNITIIPQAPELISGTLRKNLDMFGKHDDPELNDALRSAGLFSLQSDADENRLTLDSKIAAGGGNLSTGQRQIIALARAIVRQSKVLLLDEATSAIDYETDAIIQASLRTELKRDVTVISVAHRLQTVMDSDKIMVLDAGKLVEFASPDELLQTEGSFLRALVDESADKEELYAMAARVRDTV